MTNHANARPYVEAELVSTISPKAVPVSIKVAAFAFADDLHKEKFVVLPRLEKRLAIKLR